MRGGTPVAIAVIALLCAAAARAAVTDYIGKPIAAVHLMLEGRETTDPALTQVVATLVGRPLAMADVRESITHLFSLGRFEDVRVDASLAGGRVVLRYDLSPIHPVTRIAFEAQLRGTGLSTGQLRRAIVDRYGASPPLGRATDMSRIVADALQERGYLHAVVTPRADISHRPERATLVFAVQPGPRTLVGDIEIAGAPPINRADLLAALRIAPGTPYQHDALNARIERYVESQRKRGYYEAKVIPAVQLVDEDRVARVTLTVDRGPHVRVAFAGDALAADRRADLVPVEREGSADEDLLEDSTARIEDFFRSEGYRDAAAPHTREESDGELLITFTIRKGPLYRVSRVEISGNSSAPIADLEPALRLRDGQPFSAAKLDADVGSIEEWYHRHGFATAKAESAVTPEAPPSAADVPVLVRIVVREGPRTMVSAVRFVGNQSLDEATLRQSLSLQPDKPFVVAQLAADRDAVEQQYADHGFANATVDATPDISRDGTRAEVVYTVREGPQIFVDHVLIVGNVRTSTDTIERALQIKSGDPLGREAVYESQRRLATLGLFRRSTINEVRHGEETKRDLLVTVEEAPATTLGYGGGVEGRLRAVRSETGVATDQFEVAPRAFVEIGRRNLFGKNRSANGFASISLHPTDTTVSPDPNAISSVVGYGLTEYRLIGTYREPRIFNTAGDAFINATLEQQIRTGFNFRRRGASAEVARRITRAVSFSGSYQIQRTEVFDVKLKPTDPLVPLIDRTFTQVLLSSFTTSVIRDTRDDQVDPGSGEYFSANGQLAARAIGSEVGFVKSFFTAQAFRTLPHTRRIVFAANARVGLAAGFPRPAVDPNGAVIFGADGQPAEVRDLPQSERFYAGGDTTVRGFALDTLGVRHDPPSPSDTIDKDGFPIGGNGLMIFNGELRVPVRGSMGVVGFVDTGNVFQHATDLGLGELRTAVGGGIRYKSPIGPIRFDLGVKVNRHPNEGLTAWFITFGQAF